MPNTSLRAAKSAKEDEFYTQLTDIEKELRHYKQHFEGKTVFCNCDDPFESNFFKYFVLNFNRLGLKKLIATCYVGSPIANQQLSLFDVLGETEEQEGKPYKAVVTTVYDKTGDGGVDMFDVAELFKSGENELSELKGDGDFRSQECLSLLNEADIVVTNPPFSLFREYIAALLEHKKKFVIIGNQNAVHYKEIFPLLRDGKVWLGYNHVKEFTRPDGTIQKFGNVLWYTNLDIKKRHEDLILVQRYKEDKYPKYYNYDGIDVGQLSDIPLDYAGHMGVPDNFLEVFNPDQFEVIGTAAEVPKTKKHVSYKRQNIITYEKDGEILWQTEYSISERKAGNSLRIDEGGKPGDLPYSRILIRNKRPEEPKEATNDH